MLARALRGPLLPAQQAAVLAELEADPLLVHHCGLSPRALPALVEHNPALAIEVLSGKAPYLLPANLPPALVPRLLLSLHTCLSHASHSPAVLPKPAASHAKALLRLLSGPAASRAAGKYLAALKASEANAPFFSIYLTSGFLHSHVGDTLMLLQYAGFALMPLQYAGTAHAGPGAEPSRNGGGEPPEHRASGDGLAGRLCAQLRAGLPRRLRGALPLLSSR